MHLAKGLPRVHGRALAGATEGEHELLPSGLSGVRGRNHRDAQGCPFPKDTLATCTRAVVLKLDRALESIGDFKTLLMEPHAWF